MSKHFKINVNNEFDLDISEHDISAVDIVRFEHSKFHVIQNNKTYNSEIIESNFNQKTYKVKVNKNTYNININSDLDQLIKKMGFEVGAAKKINDIKAPMPGLILEVNVKVGQSINENEPLLILEAMKMENVINAPRDGVIKSISIAKGDAVDKNQLLIEFE